MNVQPATRRRRRVRVRQILAVTLAHVLLVAGLFQPVQAQTGSSRLFVPLVRADTPSLDATTDTSCALSAQEKALAALMAAQAEQQRPALVCHAVLAKVARARAEDMARRDYFSHVNPDGFGPNYLVIQAGFPLLSWYDQRPAANNIESLAAGYGDAAKTWNAWLNSPSHRVHVLGLNDFYANQVLYGVGYFRLEGSTYVNYWVVITAPKPE
jgi:uncharacterized protein YkwD